MNSDNLIGKTLGTCTLEKLIGQGGMGVVYLARQVRPSRTVAVKVLFPNITLSSDIYQEFLTRFRREADRCSIVASDLTNDECEELDRLTAKHEATVRQWMVLFAKWHRYDPTVPASFHWRGLLQRLRDVDSGEE